MLGSYPVGACSADQRMGQFVIAGRIGPEAVNLNEAPSSGIY
jgi:hypothetical protein